MEIRELATTDTYNKKMIPNLGIIFSFPQKTYQYKKIYFLEGSLQFLQKLEFETHPKYILEKNTF
jgi:hypothetical protein